jgi:tryptophanyl-tRNA synthetase
MWSAVQPTGRLHLGNYFGAIQQWISLQNSVKTKLESDDGHHANFIPAERNFKPIDTLIVGLADRHALTNPSTYSSIDALNMAAELLALGLDPHKVILKRSSRIMEHANLAWLLSCLCPIQRLNLMTQYKSKLSNKESHLSELENAGLFMYPVLQAADILIYKASEVPVGEDQSQHLELTRLLAQKFNTTFKSDFFPLPETRLLPPASTMSKSHETSPILAYLSRLKSLADGRKKMSKSDLNGFSRINITDSSDDIQLKIRKAKTDCHNELVFNPEERPEITNLLAIYYGTTMLSQPVASLDSLCAQYNRLPKNERYTAFKKDLTDALVAHFSPVRQKYLRLIEDRAGLGAILVAGEEKARAIASTNFESIEKLIGFKLN